MACEALHPAKVKLVRPRARHHTQLHLCKLTLQWRSSSWTISSWTQTFQARRE